jgi:hypothetical protein
MSNEQATYLFYGFIVGWGAVLFSFALAKLLDYIEKRLS